MISLIMNETYFTLKSVLRRQSIVRNMFILSMIETSFNHDQTKQNGGCEEKVSAQNIHIWANYETMCLIEIIIYGPM